ARLFGRGKDKDTDEVNEDSAPKETRAPLKVASVTAPKSKPVSLEHIVTVPTARPHVVAVASATPPAPKQTFVTASLGSNVFDNRGYWRGPVQPAANLPAVVTGEPYKTASAEPVATTGSTRLPYPTEAEPPPARIHARPIGSQVPSQVAPPPKEATVITGPGNTTVVAKPPGGAATGGAPHKEDVGLRAAALTPSISRYMTAMRIGHSSDTHL